jgi:cell division protease FtsH
MGGRCAEKIIFNNFTTGAGNDISVATDIAKKMVCEWGMSDTIGPLTFGRKNEEIFLGREMSVAKDYSDEKSKLIDEEITLFIKNAEKRADKILKENTNHLHTIANALLDCLFLSKFILDSLEIFFPSINKFISFPVIVS